MADGCPPLKFTRAFSIITASAPLNGSKNIEPLMYVARLSRCATDDSFIQPNVPSSGPLPGGAEGPYVPSVQAFADAINANPVMSGLFDNIFLQASPLNEVCNTPWRTMTNIYFLIQVMTFDTLLFILDWIVVQPPRFHRPDGEGEGEPIAVPIYLLLDLLINTSAAL
jgi:phosphatidylserine decarboxylase